MATFGEQLKMIREKRGLSQRQVAALAENLTASTVLRVERDDRDPQLATLEALARGLNVSFVISPKGIFIREEDIAS